MMQPGAETKIREAMDIAMGHQKAGRLRAAGNIYRRILRIDPENADALHFLGVIAHKVGRPEIALALLARSVAADPHRIGFQVNLGNLYLKQQRVEEAIACYQRAIDLEPNSASAHAHLAAAFARAGRLEEANQSYACATELRPLPGRLATQQPAAPQPSGPAAPVAAVAVADTAAEDDEAARGLVEPFGMIPEVDRPTEASPPSGELTRELEQVDPPAIETLPAVLSEPLAVEGTAEENALGTAHEEAPSHSGVGYLDDHPAGPIHATTDDAPVQLMTSAEIEPTALVNEAAELQPPVQVVPPDAVVEPEPLQLAAAGQAAPSEPDIHRDDLAELQPVQRDGGAEDPALGSEGPVAEVVPVDMAAEPDTLQQVEPGHAAPLVSEPDLDEATEPLPVAADDGAQANAADSAGSASRADCSGDETSGDADSAREAQVESVEPAEAELSNVSSETRVVEVVEVADFVALPDAAPAETTAVSDAASSEESSGLDVVVSASTTIEPGLFSRITPETFSNRAEEETGSGVEAAALEALAAAFHFAPADVARNAGPGEAVRSAGSTRVADDHAMSDAPAIELAAPSEEATRELVCCESESSSFSGLACEARAALQGAETAVHAPQSGPLNETFLSLNADPALMAIEGTAPEPPPIGVGTNSIDFVIPLDPAADELAAADVEPSEHLPALLNDGALTQEYAWALRFGPAHHMVSPVDGEIDLEMEEPDAALFALAAADFVPGTATVSSPDQAFPESRLEKVNRLDEEGADGPDGPLFAEVESLPEPAPLPCSPDADPVIEPAERSAAIGSEPGVTVMATIVRDGSALEEPAALSPLTDVDPPVDEAAEILPEEAVEILPLPEPDPIDAPEFVEVWNEEAAEPSNGDASDISITASSTPPDRDQVIALDGEMADLPARDTGEQEFELDDPESLVESLGPLPQAGDLAQADGAGQAEDGAQTDRPVEPDSALTGFDAAESATLRAEDDALLGAIPSVGTPEGSGDLAEEPETGSSPPGPSTDHDSIELVESRETAGEGPSAHDDMVLYSGPWKEGLDVDQPAHEMPAVPALAAAREWKSDEALAQSTKLNDHDLSQISLALPEAGTSVQAAPAADDLAQVPAGLLGEAHARVLAGNDVMSDGSNGAARVPAIDRSAETLPLPGAAGVTASLRAEAADAMSARRRPPSAESLRRRAVNLMGFRRLDEAIALLRQAVKLRPRFAEGHRDLGGALLRRGNLEEAITSLQRALRMRPSFAEAWGSLGDAYQLEGKIKQAIRCYRRLLRLVPKAAKVHSNMLLSMNYDATFSARQVYQEHVRWAERHADPLARRLQPHANDRSPDRPLKIGYVSPDFRRHSVNYFAEPILAAHFRDEFHVTCYSDAIRPDGVTHGLAEMSESFRDTHAMSDEQLAEQVRRDGIDILVDLSGHTGNNRLGTFARKPAPVQVTYLGYPNTTGLSTIDYRITDALADPPGMTEHLHTEQLVRLPNTFLCYQPPHDSPEVGPLPCLKTGYVTFGCFNILAKVTDEVMKLWARILQELPNSRLVLKGRSSALSNETRRQHVRDVFIQSGIPASRLELLGKEPSYADHLAHYRRLDIVLDPFPYNGTTTTCEALWMGLPVVTLAGDRHVSRVGVSILTNVGLPEMIASNPAQYVKIATGLADNPRNLSRMRAGLRERMLRSPLTDAVHTARALEAEYRHMWAHWCHSVEAGLPAVRDTLTLTDG